MMKKQKGNNLVTKSFLKSYLTRKLNQLEDRLEKRLDFKMEQRFKEFKNDILTMKDAHKPSLRIVFRKKISPINKTLLLYRF